MFRLAAPHAALPHTVPVGAGAPASRPQLPLPLHHAVPEEQARPGRHHLPHWAVDLGVRAPQRGRTKGGRDGKGAVRGRAWAGVKCSDCVRHLSAHMCQLHCRRQRLKETGRGPAFNPQLTGRTARSRSSRSLGRRSSGGSGGSRSRVRGPTRYRCQCTHIPAHLVSVCAMQSLQRSKSERKVVGSRRVRSNSQEPPSRRGSAEGAGSGRRSLSRTRSRGSVGDGGVSGGRSSSARRLSGGSARSRGRVSPSPAPKSQSPMLSGRRSAASGSPYGGSRGGTPVSVVRGGSKSRLRGSPGPGAPAKPLPAFGGSRRL